MNEIYIVVEIDPGYGGCNDILKLYIYTDKEAAMKFAKKTSSDVYEATKGVKELFSGQEMINIY